jgi:serine/threonine protein phosphatase 1
MHELIKRFEKNKYGRDFVAGDIHGHFTDLEKALEAVGFDKAFDRLFAAGDLIDRGPESYEAAYYLQLERWFYSVLGNHEQMAIDAFNPEYPDAKYHHMQQGGMWLYGLPTVEQQCTILTFEDLPLGIEVETDRGLIGIVHAEVPHCNWNEFKNLYNDNKEHFTTVALWSRSRLARGTTRQVWGIDHVYVGHSFVENPTTLGNVTYLDTGSGFKGGRITLVQIQ